MLSHPNPITQNSRRFDLLADFSLCSSPCAHTLLGNTARTVQAIISSMPVILVLF